MRVAGSTGEATGGAEGKWLDARRMGSGAVGDCAGRLERLTLIFATNLSSGHKSE